ncbi:MAG: sigma-70 family RNA polymerase sigma factor, partial [Actinomycetota bacterium]|nr:sigma-70 family RNA polymerase sigma factor [Actinomycetota bacterium]
QLPGRARQRAYLDPLHSPPSGCRFAAVGASRRRTQDKAEASAEKSQPSEAFSEAWRSTQREQVRQALGTLPPEQLNVLELAYFSGYTHVEIAELLDLPLGTVKGRMRLGLKKIKNYFDSRGMAIPG